MIAVADVDARDEPFIGTVEYSGNRYAASCRIIWDGLEYVGRLWFANVADSDDWMTDRGALPGRTPEEVVALARRLTPDELQRRVSRANAEKRRYLELRSVMDVMIAKVRYMNQVAISMHAGLLDAEGASGELELTERQLHELVDTLRQHAGVEN